MIISVLCHWDNSSAPMTFCTYTGPMKEGAGAGVGAPGGTGGGGVNATTDDELLRLQNQSSSMLCHQI